MLPKHPMQPLVKDSHGTIRFKENKIVSFLLDACRDGRSVDLNEIAVMPFSQEDRVQLAQLIGYSLCGFHELNYVPDAVAIQASNAAKSKFGDEVGGCRDTGCEMHVGVEDETTL